MLSVNDGTQASENGKLLYKGLDEEVGETADDMALYELGEFKKKLQDNGLTEKEAENITLTDVDWKIVEGENPVLTYSKKVNGKDVTIDVPLEPFLDEKGSRTGLVPLTSSTAGLVGSTAGRKRAESYLRSHKPDPNHKERFDNLYGIDFYFDKDDEKKKVLREKYEAIANQDYYKGAYLDDKGVAHSFDSEVLAFIKDGQSPAEALETGRTNFQVYAQKGYQKVRETAMGDEPSNTEVDPRTETAMGDEPSNTEVDPRTEKAKKARKQRVEGIRGTATYKKITEGGRGPLSEEAWLAKTRDYLNKIGEYLFYYPDATDEDIFENVDF